MIDISIKPRSSRGFCFPAICSYIPVMSSNKDAQGIINLLNNQNYTAICPCCDAEIPLSESGLFYLDDFTPEGKTLFKEYKAQMTVRRRELKERRDNLSISSSTRAEATNLGFILEKLAPGLTSFRFKRNDCRALFDPIDYVIFEGLTTKEKVSKLLFVDVKTGESRLTSKQREIKNLVNDKKVQFYIYEEDN